MRLLVLLLAVALSGSALAHSVQLHVKLLSQGHLHVKGVPGGGVNAVSVTSGSEVTITAGGGTSSGSDEGDLAVVLPDSQTGTLTISDNLPDPRWFTEYCHKLHYVPTTVTFTDVSTGVEVSPHLEGTSIVLTITPFIHYHAASGEGTLSLREISTKLSTIDGGTVVLSPKTARGKAVYRYIFGGNTPSPSYLQFTPDIVKE
ncbi:MAG TPA: hypothetical protein VGO93_22120 [Candidatus Xenobia bacterium]|jgi:hypothetical protein